MLSSEGVEDPLILNSFRPLDVVIDHKPGADTLYWHRYLLQIEQQEIMDVVSKLTSLMKKGWYSIFWNEKTVYVVFKNKNFSLKRETNWGSAAYQKVQAYATSHGVQKEYFDFNERFIHYTSLIQEVNERNRMHHVAFTVNNLDESITWYKEKLGFTLVNKFIRPVRSTALLKKDDVQIELFGITGGPKPLPLHRSDLLEDLNYVGTKHLCIQVNDMKKTIIQLQKKGVEFVTKPDSASFGGQFVFFKDCNNILIELLAPAW